MWGRHLDLDLDLDNNCRTPTDIAAMVFHGEMVKHVSWVSLAAILKGGPQRPQNSWYLLRAHTG